MVQSSTLSLSLVEEKQQTLDILNVPQELSAFNGKVFRFGAILKSSASRSWVLVLTAFGCSLLCMLCYEPSESGNETEHQLNLRNTLKLALCMTQAKVAAGRANYKDTHEFQIP